MTIETSSPAAATLIVRDEAGEHLAIQRIRLTGLSGADFGRVYTAQDGRLTMGTHERCNVVLREQTVSRWHCELQVHGHLVAVTDLGSSNGTCVDGVLIERAFLQRGAVLALGRASFRFDVAEDPVRIPVSPRTRFGRMAGVSPASRAVFALLERAATSDATVLLYGETGTGKEVAAHSLHEQSPRKHGPFVTVDCASIPPELLESELFGHTRGSFTGAVSDRVGAFEAAHGGTIFLDEIGELPLPLQPKLLRALEAREIKRVGSTTYRPVDVRVIAATHRDLAREAAASRFRSDLYYRLAVVEIRIPALRERLDDLPTIIDALLDELGVDAEDAAKMRRPEALLDLHRHPWPGNVRELRNHLERVLALGTEALAPRPTSDIDCDDRAQSLIDVEVPLKIARERWTRELERRYLAALLQAHKGNVSSAARSAGIDRSHLHRLLARASVRSE